MIVKKSYKIRLYPTKSQKVFFNKTMGACMLVENPPMDESSIKNIKSSDSMKQEQLI